MHQDRSAKAAQCLGVGVGADQGGPIAEFSMGVPQGRQNQVNFLPVVTVAPECRGRLDEHNGAPGVFTAVNGRPELIGEQPQRGVRLRH